jgi:NAD(P)H-flavin reductase
MKDSRAQVENVKEINKQYLQLELGVEDEALKQIKPGQSILARIADKSDEDHIWNPYLREQWWVWGVTGRDVLRVELPRVRDYEIGEKVQLLGPIGQPFRFRKNLRHVLLLAYNTHPVPLTVMTSSLLKNKVSVALVLLGEARSYNAAHLAPEIEVIRADDMMQWDNMVMSVGWADQIFVVVSQDDERARFKEVYELLKSKRDIPEMYLFGVFQSLLPCGVGACDACVLKMKEGIKRVCTDGPAFDLTTVKLD